MAPRTEVVLVWIPPHVGIPGNEKVDELAKLALNKEVHDDKQVIWSDLKLKPPPRAPVPEESESGDMDNDLGSALSADPGGCPLSPLVLVQKKCSDSPPSPEPAEAAKGKKCKCLAGPPSGGLPGSK
ncbi:hypothetical protein ElyMa_004526900 [Elysia marginata]|uniref:RNase H type-1 domain-containing protein n=1 Tax=Elysia marginata TaxID=1093978 RepID=A0AAV4HQA3_9GAST|nr:hypothetical protein ElyMa_004526900 [Elysia marginata]